MTYTTLVIFGISGDLATRKLLPALAYLETLGALPDGFAVVGTSRRELNANTLLDGALTGIEPRVRDRLARRLQLIRLDSSDPREQSRLRKLLDARDESSAAPATRLFYLSIPPAAAEPVIRAMAAAGSGDESQAPVRLLMEKPFGYDLASATELDRLIHTAFREDQIYRIDHYLSKETAQNINVFRFHNPIMTRLWNGEEIERIELSASEALGIENRSDFYEQTGALRDILQSHLLNLAALVLMEEPANDSPECLQQARLVLLEAIKPIAPNRVQRLTKRGQYNGYRAETGNRDSVIETYAELKLEVDNDRWRGVPLVICTGKSLAEKRTEIRIIFRGNTRNRNERNELIFRLQPNEGIEITVETKTPGLTQTVTPITLNYTYPKLATDTGVPDGYARVLADAIGGDRGNFVSGREVLASWRIVEHVLHEWAKGDDGLVMYDKGVARP